MRTRTLGCCTAMDRRTATLTKTNEGFRFTSTPSSDSDCGEASDTFSLRIWETLSSSSRLQAEAPDSTAVFRTVWTSLVESASVSPGDCWSSATGDSGTAGGVSSQCAADLGESSTNPASSSLNPNSTSSFESWASAGPETCTTASSRRGLLTGVPVDASSSVGHWFVSAVEGWTHKGSDERISSLPVWGLSDLGLGSCCGAGSRSGERLLEGGVWSPRSQCTVGKGWDSCGCTVLLVKSTKDGLVWGEGSGGARGNLSPADTVGVVREPSTDGSWWLAETEEPEGLTAIC